MKKKNNGNKAMKKYLKNKARKARAEALYEFNNTVHKVKTMQAYFEKLKEQDGVQ